MTVRAVLFDWGGTLTPYHQVDLLDLWRVAARMFAPGRVDEVAQALLDAETRWWQAAVASGRSGTTEEIVRAAAAATGIDVPAALHSTRPPDRCCARSRGAGSAPACCPTPTGPGSGTSTGWRATACSTCSTPGSTRASWRT